MATMLDQTYQPTTPTDPNQGLVGSYRWGALGETATPTISGPDPSWFVAPEWQLGELQADRDIAAGAVTTYDSSQDFLNSL
jgi:hypothetical protein